MLLDVVSTVSSSVVEEKIYARKGLNIRLEYSPATNLDFINTGHGNIQVQALTMLIF